MRLYFKVKSGDIVNTNGEDVNITDVRHSSGRTFIYIGIMPLVLLDKDKFICEVLYLHANIHEKLFKSLPR